MAILKNGIEREHTIIPNSAIRDGRLRLQDIGMLCFMFSMPDGWNLSSNSVAEYLKNDDKNAVIESLRRLKEIGYLTVETTGGKERKGKVITISPAPPQKCENDKQTIDSGKPEQKPIEKQNRRIKPTLQEVREYCEERKNGIDPVAFMDFYDTNGWVQGRGKPIKDWKAAVRTWEQRRKENNNGGEKYQYKYGDISGYADILDGFDG